MRGIINVFSIYMTYGLYGFVLLGFAHGDTDRSLLSIAYDAEYGDINVSAFYRNWSINLNKWYQ